MNNKDVASLLGELIEADKDEWVSLERLLNRYGVVGFFQKLDERMPLSTESLEKLQALQSLIDILSKRYVELGEGNGCEPAPHQ
ncbi:hypothetical protein [Paenibacillus azoreducens]|uniref:Uncharacterized protein n=1 Tax=Paenibacillus azoreducens TaxID=116718 RepID=A0A920CSF5_9BACL|nr:hypothetical protein [Paenibacillus azoreducens]GIO47383.1 hypothetical protein J34TS1_21480 [Paenibacillus azoreducens]